MHTHATTVNFLYMYILNTNTNDNTFDCLGDSQWGLWFPVLSMYVSILL